MKQILKKFFTTFGILFASIAFQISASATFNPTYSGVFYFNNMPATGHYMSISSDDAIMHCVLYDVSGNNIFLCASKAQALHLDSSYLNVYYPGSVSAYCYRSYGDGSYHSSVSLPIIIQSNSISVSGSSVTITYNTYPYTN